MEPAQAIIWTTIFNIVFTGLVGGIVIYTLQKKIDASIQKSMFEYQTKFARSYPKTLEVIEGYIQKFQGYVDLCSDSVVRLGLPKVNRFYTEQEMFEFETDLIGSACSLHDYIWRNRMYLSDHVFAELDEISTIVVRCELFRDHIDEAAQSGMSEVAVVNIRRRARSLTGLPFSLELIPNDKDHLRTLMTELLGRLMMLTERLDKLYKSVAEAQ